MNGKKLQGRTALITGASKGLGKAMALALADVGARVILVSRNLEQLNETAAAVRKLGAEAVVFQADDFEHIFGAGPHGHFLAGAVHEFCRLQSPADVKGADTFGGVNLVTGNR